MTRSGDLLISRIVAGGDDSAAHDLLNEFFSGYPVERLRRLLQSEEESAVKAGAWIASELGEQVAPLIDELTGLLSHPSKYVRFFVLDSILIAGTPEHGQALAAAVQMIQDSEDAIRWKAMNFLARASESQLTASVPYVANRSVAELTEWLIDSDRRLNTVAVIRRLEDGNQLVRMAAGAAAVRLASRDRSALEHAAASSDPTIKSFADEHLRFLAGGR